MVRPRPRYEIRIEGVLDNRWAVWFDGLTVTRCSDGTTTIDGSVVDQSALHGLLRACQMVCVGTAIGC